MDKFNLLYNELACNFGVGTEPFRGPFKAALDAYIEERVNAMVEHCPIRLPDTPVKPVEGKNAVVSAEGNTYSHDLGPLRAVDDCKPFTDPTKPHFRPLDAWINGHQLFFEANKEPGRDEIDRKGIQEILERHAIFDNKRPEVIPLPVVGRCKDCKHWERIGRYGKCNNVIVEGGAHEADFSGTIHFTK